MTSAQRYVKKKKRQMRRLGPAEVKLCTNTELLKEHKEKTLSAVINML